MSDGGGVCHIAYDGGAYGGVVSTREGGFVAWVVRGVLWRLTGGRFGRPRWEHVWIPGTERFYAVGPDGVISTSQDGIEWEAYNRFADVTARLNRLNNA